MASPFCYFIYPDCGIDVNVVDKDKKLEKKLNPTSLRTVRKYKICLDALKNEVLDPNAIKKLDSLGDLCEGNLSPLSPISLPPHSMKLAGIPSAASYYAYIHPPSDLIDLFDYDEILRCGDAGEREHIWSNDSTQEESTLLQKLQKSQKYKHLATSNFAVFGGFAYYAKDYKLLRVNALSMTKTEYRLHLAGPYEVTQETSNAMADLARSSSVALNLFQEAGFVAKSFVRPGEMFNGKYVVNKKLSVHGAFIFHKDNGTSIAYVVARNVASTVDDDKIFQCLADCHNTIHLVDSFSFSKENVHHDDFSECMERVQRWQALQPSDDLEDENGFPLLHQALKVQCPLDVIKKIVKIHKFKNEKDKFGWSALHYACRFNADNLELITWLLSKDALNEADNFGRYPLHLACDSSPSLDVVSFLLLVSKCSDNDLVNRSTSYLKRLPLHIACNACASTDVIEALLLADGIGKHGGNGVDHMMGNIDDSKDDNIAMNKRSLRKKTLAKGSLNKKTLAGKTALHLAINKGQPIETIELLLRGDSTIVHQWYRGMLPLHMAIMNNYGEDTIKLLMDEDKKGFSINICLNHDESTAPELPTSPVLSLVSITEDGNRDTLQKKPLMEENRLRYSNDIESEPIDEYSITKDIFNSDNDQANVIVAHRRLYSHRSLTGYTAHLHGIRALHLCFLTRSMGAARLLLQRELLLVKTAEFSDGALATDRKTGRTALHMACAINCEVDIIRLLCEADPTRGALIKPDGHGCVPLHLACNHKDAKYEVVKELLNADKNRMLEEENMSKRRWRNVGIFTFPIKSVEATDHLARNPLARSIEANAPTEVLGVLLEPIHFDVDGLDDRAKTNLAGRIKKSASLQIAMNEIMAQRVYFFQLFLQLAVNLLALVAFFIRTERELIFLELTNHWTHHVLIFCMIFFCLRELIQILSEKIKYVFDLQNVLELSSMVLLGLSLNLPASTVSDGPTSAQFILTSSAFLLVLTFIVSLRSAFLPFARFVGGLQIIFLTLLPFFIVTTAILAAFSLAYRIKFKIGKDSDTDNSEFQSQCSKSFWSCSRKTAQNFFSGGDVDNWIDIVFGIFAIIVLLNVVIAIVSDAWEDARDHATGIYWRGRINLLSQTSFISEASRKLEFGCITTLFKSIDNMKCISFKEPNFAWSTDYPYCLVRCKEEYDKPSYYLQKEVAREIEKVKSLKCDLHWLNVSINEYDNINKRVVNASFATARVWCKWLWLTFWYGVSLVIGLPFLGIWWPHTFRKQILSFGNSSEDDNDTDESNDGREGKKLREEMKKLLHRIESLEETHESTNDKNKMLGRRSILGKRGFRSSEKSLSAGTEKEYN